MPPKKTVAPSKTHTVIITLLMWVVALLVFGIGYMVYQNQSDAADEMTTGGAETKCDEAVADALAAKVCDAPAQEKATYSDSFMPLSFQYYKGWHIYTFTDGGTGSSKLYMNTEPMSDCSECSGGLEGIIGASSRKLAAGETGKTAYTAQLATLQADANIVITSQSESATGGLLTWTDNNPCDGVGCAEGDHQVWYASSAAMLYTAGFEDDGRAERSAAWALFLSTVTIK